MASADFKKVAGSQQSKLSEQSEKIDELSKQVEKLNLQPRKQDLTSVDQQSRGMHDVELMLQLKPNIQEQQNKPNLLPAQQLMSKEVKWTFLEHKGPVFEPPYEPLPESVQLLYDGEPMRLSLGAEEAAGFYARLLGMVEFTSNQTFNRNFFHDWRSVMTEEEQARIKLLEKCDFKPIYTYYEQKAAARKDRSLEEKQREKVASKQLHEEYGFCKIDGVTHKIANYRVCPPGLFRGRGNHPSMGKLKLRVTPEDVVINCSKDSKIPKPPIGHKWKEVRHDNSASWLACYVENVRTYTMYIFPCVSIGSNIGCKDEL